MGENSVSKLGAGQPNHKVLTTREEIQALKMDDKAKNFLNSVFGELDTSSPSGNKPDNILQQKDGEIFMFDDGTVSIMKDGKLYAGINNKGKSFTVKDDKIVYTNDNSKAKDYFDQKTNVLTKETPNGTKYEYQYDGKNKLLYSQVTTKDKQRFIYSPENAKIATVNHDGGILANVGNAASLDDVVKALGVDEAKKSAFIKANSDAVKNGFSENSTVVIPPEAAKGLDINKLVALAHRDETKAAEKAQSSAVKPQEKPQVKSSAPAEVKKTAVHKKTPEEIKAAQRAQLEAEMNKVLDEFEKLAETEVNNPDLFKKLTEFSKTHQAIIRKFAGKLPKYENNREIILGDRKIYLYLQPNYDKLGKRHPYWQIGLVEHINNK